jgi:hypothetical protein
MGVVGDVVNLNAPVAAVPYKLFLLGAGGETGGCSLFCLLFVSCCLSLSCSLSLSLFLSLFLTLFLSPSLDTENQGSFISRRVVASTFCMASITKLKT